MNKKFFLILLIFFSITKADIVSDLQLKNIDSLIITNQYNDVNNFFQNIDIELSNSDIDEYEFKVYSKIKNQYLRLCNYLLSMKDKDKTDYINSYKSIRNEYTEIKVGKMSKIYFDKFFIQIETDINKAFIYYNISYARRIIFYYKKDLRINENINLVKKYIELENYNFANSILDFLSLTSNKKTNDPDLISEIDSLKNHVKYQAYLQGVENQYHLTNKQINNKNMFGISFYSFIQSTSINENTNWMFNYILSDDFYTLLIDEINFQKGSGYALNYNYFIFDKISIGLTFYSNKMQYKVQDQKKILSFPVDIKFKSISPSINYYFKTGLGFRPYIGYGFQLNKIKRMEINTQWNSSDYSKLHKSGEIEMISQSRFIIGCDYINSNIHDFLFKLSFNDIMNHSQSKIIGKNSLFLEIGIFYCF